MGDAGSRKDTKYTLGNTNSGEKISPIAVPPKTAFRALGIGRKLGYRWIKEGVIPTVRPGGRRMLVLVRELERLLSEMVKVDHTCRTCAKKDEKGRCAVFVSPPKDVRNCPAWTFDRDWNLKVFAATREYEGRKK